LKSAQLAEDNSVSYLVRLAQAADGGDVAEIYKPFVTSTPTSFELDPPSGAEMGEHIEEYLQRYPFLVAEEAGRVIGYAYAGAHRVRACYVWSVDVSAYVREGYRGQGIGRELYRRLNAILKLQGFFHAYAGITLPNPGSIGLHTSIGFRPVGVYEKVGFKLGAWHDVGWYQLEIAEPIPNPGLPIWFSEVRDTEQVKEILRR